MTVQAFLPASWAYSKPCEQHIVTGAGIIACFYCFDLPQFRGPRMAAVAALLWAFGAAGLSLTYLLSFAFSVRACQPVQLFLAHERHACMPLHHPCAARHLTVLASFMHICVSGRHPLRLEIAIRCQNYVRSVPHTAQAVAQYRGYAMFSLCLLWSRHVTLAPAVVHCRACTQMPCALTCRTRCARCSASTASHSWPATWASWPRSSWTPFINYCTRPAVKATSDAVKAVLRALSPHYNLARCA